MRNILKLDPADTKQQLCDAEVIRQQHFCSVLSPALSCTYSLWPGPAILGLYLLFFPSFFFPILGSVSTEYILGEHPEQKYSSPVLAAGPDTVTFTWIIQRCCSPRMHCSWGAAEHWGEQEEIKRYWAAVLPFLSSTTPCCHAFILTRLFAWPQDDLEKGKFHTK